MIKHSTDNNNIFIIGEDDQQIKYAMDYFSGSTFSVEMGKYTLSHKNEVKNDNTLIFKPCVFEKEKQKTAINNFSGFCKFIILLDDSTLELVKSKDTDHYLVNLMRYLQQYKLEYDLYQSTLILYSDMFHQIKKTTCEPVIRNLLAHTYKEPSLINFKKDNVFRLELTDDGVSRTKILNKLTMLDSLYLDLAPKIPHVSFWAKTTNNFEAHRQYLIGLALLMCLGYLLTKMDVAVDTVIIFGLLSSITAAIIKPNINPMLANFSVPISELANIPGNINKFFIKSDVVGDKLLDTICSTDKHIGRISDAAIETLEFGKEKFEIMTEAGVGLINESKSQVQHVGQTTTKAIESTQQEIHQLASKAKKEIKLTSEQIQMVLSHLDKSLEISTHELIGFINTAEHNLKITSKNFNVQVGMFGQEARTTLRLTNNQIQDLFATTKSHMLNLNYQISNFSIKLTNIINKNSKQVGTLLSSLDKLVKTTETDINKISLDLSTQINLVGGQTQDTLATLRSSLTNVDRNLDGFLHQLNQTVDNNLHNFSDITKIELRNLVEGINKALDDGKLKPQAIVTGNTATVCTLF